jgi:hypothetical protein
MGLLDKWITEAMAEDHQRGIDHGSGLSSTGGVWCPTCYHRWVQSQLREGQERMKAEQSASTFYGSCKVCGKGYWATVETGPGGQMLGPHLVLVCQRHHPVGEAELVNDGMMTSDALGQWLEWRERVEANESQSGDFR